MKSKVQLSFNIDGLLKQADEHNGMGPLALEISIKQYLKEFSSKQVEITLDNRQKMEFLLFTENGKTVIISASCLASNCNQNEGVNIELLPEILQKLADKKVQFDLMQLPHALRVTGWLSGTTYREHFNHIILRKEKNQIITGLIDSTMNPFGVSNPLGLFSRSILSFQELTHHVLGRLCNTDNARTALSTLCGIDPMRQVVVANTNYSGQQPNLNNKRCGIYVMKGMAELANSVLQKQTLNHDTITAIINEAHQQVTHGEQHQALFR